MTDETPEERMEAHLDAHDHADEDTPVLDVPEFDEDDE